MPAELFHAVSFEKKSGTEGAEGREYLLFTLYSFVNCLCF